MSGRRFGFGCVRVRNRIRRVRVRIIFRMWMAWIWVSARMEAYRQSRVFRTTCHIYMHAYKICTYTYVYTHTFVQSFIHAFKNVGTCLLRYLRTHAHTLVHTCLHLHKGEASWTKRSVFGARLGARAQWLKPHSVRRATHLMYIQSYHTLHLPTPHIPGRSTYAHTYHISIHATHESCHAFSLHLPTPHSCRTCRPSHAAHL